MSNYIEKNAYYYLRSLPVFAGTLIYFIFLRIHPELVGALNSYITDSNPEDNFAQYGWSLYYIIIPFCIASFARIKSHWPLALALMLYPIALSLSYWLWELLGWVVMGAYLMGLFTIALAADDRSDTKHDVYVGFVTTDCIVYAILRVIGGLGAGSLLGWADVGFICVLGGYFIVTGLIETFRYEDGYDTMVYPSFITVFYILIIALMLPVMAGGKWSDLSFGGAERKQYNALVGQAEQAKNVKDYRAAAESYRGAAALRFQERNLSMANLMTQQADSLEAVLVKQIPRDLNALRKEKRSSATFDAHAQSIENDILLLEKNASKATAPSTIKDYRKRLETQRNRKK